jgi:hypothetical protein
MIKTPTIDVLSHERPTPRVTVRPSWKRSAGYATGLALALSGLVFGAVSAAQYAVRMAGGGAGEPALAVGVRVAGGVMLVLAGFGVMVLSIRGVDADEGDPPEVRTSVEAAAAGDDILCARCGAANDHLARFCDQCGRRL